MLSYEKLKLKKAVNNFSEKMENRLLEKADEGYSGWDEKTKDMKEFFEYGIIQDLRDILINNNETKENYIDIANRAMFLARFCEEDK